MAMSKQCQSLFRRVVVDDLLEETETSGKLARAFDSLVQQGRECIAAGLGKQLLQVTEVGCVLYPMGLSLTGQALCTMRNQHLGAALRLALDPSSGQSIFGTKNNWNHFETMQDRGSLPFFGACRRRSFQLKEMGRPEEQRKFAINVIDVISRWNPHRNYETELRSPNRSLPSTADRPFPDFPPSADRFMNRQKSTLLRTKKSWQDALRRSGRVNK